MNKLELDIRIELCRLKEIQMKLQEREKPKLSGKVHVSKNHNSYRYMYKEEGKERKYIGKEKQALIKALIQKEYDEKVLRKVNQQIRDLEKIVMKYNSDDLLNVYIDMPLGKRIHIEPCVLSQEDYIKKWINDKEYKKENYKKMYPQKYELSNDEENSNITEKGEVVRSKSEKIIADKLNTMGIPYVYEVPLYLSSYGNVMPDFYVLNKKTRKEYIWEHFGKWMIRNMQQSKLRKLNLMKKMDICKERI